MVVSLLLCVGALGLSQASLNTDDQGSTTAQAPVAGAYSAEQDQSGYEEAPQTYSTKRGWNYEMGVKYSCVGSCPPEAPCFSPVTGTCVASVAYAAPSQQYAQPQSYDDQQQQQSGYRRLAIQGSCPDGTVDTSHNTLTSLGRSSLWVGFAIFLLSALYYLCRFSFFFWGEDLEELLDGNIINIKNLEIQLNRFLTRPALDAGLVCLVAALAYACMASELGYYTRCFDGRQFYYARYVGKSFSFFGLDLYDMSACDV